MTRTRTRSATGIQAASTSPGSASTATTCANRIPSERFGPTIGDVNAVAPGKRILIAETAASAPGYVQASQISGLFAGIKDQQILGFVWFDVAQAGGLYHQDWRIEDDPAAIGAFKRAARNYRW